MGSRETLIRRVKHADQAVGCSDGFCWRPTPDDDPSQIEKELLVQYVQERGQRPFANLKG
jgi:hypothetical protein